MNAQAYRHSQTVRVPHRCSLGRQERGQCSTMPLQRPTASSAASARRYKDHQLPGNHWRKLGNILLLAALCVSGFKDGAGAWTTLDVATHVHMHSFSNRMACNAFSQDLAFSARATRDGRSRLNRSRSNHNETRKLWGLSKTQPTSVTAREKDLARSQKVLQQSTVEISRSKRQFFRPFPKTQCSTNRRFAVAPEAGSMECQRTHGDAGSIA